MPLHVKLIAEYDPIGHCSKCGRHGDDTYAIVVFIAGSSDMTERVCSRCLTGGVELSASVEPADMSPGRRPPSKRLVKRTRKEEQKLADDAGGRKQVASGALPGLKGDGYLKGVARWDSKMCFSKKVSWDYDDLVKIRGEAAYGEIPAIITSYTDKATLRVAERWVTIPYEVFQDKILKC